MKMIEVLQKVANDEIKDQTILDVYDHTGDIYTYTFDEEFKAFYDEYDNEMAGDFEISNKFLNYEVDLIPPKEKKYLVKFNMRWLDKGFVYLNYTKSRNCVIIHGKVDCVTYKTHFTKSELQSIQPVREFLEDMEGKYELIEVEE
ncbi:hypothetical protein [uncultured Enterococcus sp.]|uniref:hypothetical protein n=1 Tax=uncultured Enterococcus sp. TaxID=167972 RepID=UPI0026161B55|nr:hypothetical protein [uncultured Enterococcus sp.]